jgi:cytochrome c-type biogenesis protein CcmH
MRPLTWRWLLLFWTVALTGPSLATVGEEDGQEVVDTELPPPDANPPPAAVVEGLTDQISRKLRCPVCQGSAISDSPSESAVAMRNRVRELVAEGYTEQQILDYYALRYGEWILLSPKAEGLNWLLWTVPPSLAALGLGWLGLIMTRWRNEPDEVPLPSDVGEAPIDPYEARLLEELER